MIDLSKENGEERLPPVQFNEIIENIKITDDGRQGDGIGRVAGFVVFIPQTKIGDNVDIKITRVLDNFAFAEIME